jgi:hypothetical protein
VLLRLVSSRLTFPLCVICVNGLFPHSTYVAKLYDCREEELASLVRDKRTADANYRKIKLGLEGPPPKKPAPKKKDEDDKEENNVNKKKNGKVNDKEIEAVSDKPFKPTTTKKQLVRIMLLYVFCGTLSN